MAGKTLTAAPGGTRMARRDRTVVAVAAVVSLILSPVTAVWALVIGVPAALVAWLLLRAGQTSARTAALVSAGVVLGTLPYYLLAVVTASGG